MTSEYFVIAYFGCNASRHGKPLAEWVDEKGIRDTVGPVVKAYLTRPQAWMPIDHAHRAAELAATAAARSRINPQKIVKAAGPGA